MAEIRQNEILNLKAAAAVIIKLPAQKRCFRLLQWRPLPLLTTNNQLYFVQNKFSILEKIIGFHLVDILALKSIFFILISLQL